MSVYRLFIYNLPEINSYKGNIDFFRNKILAAGSSQIGCFLLIDSNIYLEKNYYNSSLGSLKGLIIINKMHLVVSSLSFK
jgi:hypothetical protein